MLTNLMKQSVDVFRPSLTQETAQTIDGYSLVSRCVPCLIQPTDSKESWYYEQRGLENVHTVYTSNTCFEFKRNDVLKLGVRQFHIVGIVNGLTLDIYQQLTACEYPEEARKRLDIEIYG